MLSPLACLVKLVKKDTEGVSELFIVVHMTHCEQDSVN
jgi:hypothetical protein